MSAVINGLLCGIYLCISRHTADPIPVMIFLAGILSLFFAIPGFFIFWVIMLILISQRFCGRSLFRAALSIGLVLACCTVYFSLDLFRGPEGIAISLFIILSAITSIMLHFNLFKKIGSS
jgi:hypothetical protein